MSAAANVACPLLVTAAGDRCWLRPHHAGIGGTQAANKYRRVATYSEYREHAHWIIGEPGWEAIASDIERWLSTAQPQ